MKLNLNKAREWAKCNKWVAIISVLATIVFVLFCVAAYIAHNATEENEYLTARIEAVKKQNFILWERLDSERISNDILWDIIDWKDETIESLNKSNSDLLKDNSDLKSDKYELKSENEALEKNNNELRKRGDDYSHALWSLRDDYDAILINSVSFTVEGSVTVKDIHTAEIKDMSIVHSLKAVPEVCHSTPAFALLSSETGIKEIDLTIASPEGGTVFVDDGEPVIRNTGTHTIKVYKDGNVYTSYILVGREAKEVDNSIRILLP